MANDQILMDLGVMYNISAFVSVVVLGGPPPIFLARPTLNIFIISAKVAEVGG